jgi:hypothetical protein
MKFDFSETFNSFFVETGAIPGTENHEEFIAQESNEQPVEILPSYGDWEATGWMDEEDGE